jgi:polar amino acid transport system substrate-binding protein
VLAVATACGDDGGSTSTDDFEPASDDILTVVAVAPVPGFWEGQPDDYTGGFEYDLALAIADRLGLEEGIEVRTETFEELIAGEVDEYDLGMAQVSITEEREQSVDFSTPYFTSNQGILVAADAGMQVTNRAEAQAVQWGVLDVSTARTFLEDEVMPESAPLTFDQPEDMYDALRAGEVDAVLFDLGLTLGAAAESGGELEVIGQFASGDEYGAVLPKGSPNLAAVNAVIEELLADGTIDTLIEENLVPTIVPKEGDVPVVDLST